MKIQDALKAWIDVQGIRLPENDPRFLYYGMVDARVRDYLDHIDATEAEEQRKLAKAEKEEKKRKREEQSRAASAVASTEQKVGSPPTEQTSDSTKKPRH